MYKRTDVQIVIEDTDEDNYTLCASGIISLAGGLIRHSVLTKTFNCPTFYDYQKAYSKIIDEALAILDTPDPELQAWDEWDMDQVA